MLPLILGGIAAAAGITGLVKGAKARENFKKAERIVERAQREYELKKEELDEKREAVNSNAQKLGEEKLKIYTESMNAYIEKIKKIKENVKIKDRDLSEKLELEINENEIAVYEDKIGSAVQLLENAGEAIAVGVMTGVGLTGLVTTFGAASTGTAIASLSGIAAENAILAWFGGGSLAAGGLGMAAGATVFAGIVVGPALLVGGYKMEADSEKALTQAIEYQSKVEQANEKINFIIAGLDAIDKRTEEIRSIIYKINDRLQENIVKLENISLHKPTLLQKISYWIRFKKPPLQTLTKKEVKQIQVTTLLAKTLANVLETPIIDKEGHISNESNLLMDKINNSKEFKWLKA